MLMKVLCNAHHAATSNKSLHQVPEQPHRCLAAHLVPTLRGQAYDTMESSRGLADGSACFCEDLLLGLFTGQCRSPVKPQPFSVPCPTMQHLEVCKAQSMMGMKAFALQPVRHE